MRAFKLMLVCALVAACAPNYVRVTEYRGAALPLPGTNAAAGGCMVSVKGELPAGRMVYEGERCHYDSKAQ